MTIQEAKDKLNESIKNKNYRNAAYWCDFIVKSRFLYKWDGFLIDEDVETAIQIIGKNIKNEDLKETYAGKRGTLHVVTDIWHWGGAMQYLERWISTRRENTIIYVTNPKNRQGIEKIKKLNNEYCTIIENKEKDIIRSAIKLRNFAKNFAYYVIVHCSVNDLVPCFAFAHNELPIIYRNNIDDHMYWPGITVYDCILNFRSLGDDWTRKYRGTPRSCVLPLPLDERLNREIKKEEKYELRKKYGFSEKDIILISSGSTYKFNSYKNYIYIDIANEIIKNTKRTKYLIIGHPIVNNINERIIIKNIISNREEYIELLKISDIALTSLPVASQTAILEMGLVGMPCILPPKDIPMGIEDISFRHLNIPGNKEEFINMAIMYVNDERKRIEDGAYVKEKIKKYHNCNAWSEKLEQILKNSFVQHKIYNVEKHTRFDQCTVDYWNEINKKNISGKKNNNHFIFICNNYPINPIDITDIIRDRRIEKVNEYIMYYFRKIRYNLGKIKSSILDNA